MRWDQDGEARGTSTAPALGSESMRAVYRDLLRFGPRSRSELTTRLGLSAPTVTRITRELLEGGHLHLLESVARSKGRPQEPLDIEENDGPRFIGVKVTADEVHAVVTTVRGNTLEELVLPLADPSPATVEATIIDPVSALLDAHPRVAAIGVSLGGRVAGRRRVLSSGQLGWEAPHDLAGRLERCLQRPVVVENDLVAMANGLQWFGIGRAYRSFAVLTVGAGVAIGSVVEGRVIEGRTHLAGVTELLPVGPGPDGGPRTLGEAARTDELLSRARASGMLGAGEGMERLRALLAAGDPGARAIVQDVTLALARAAAAVVALLDPEAIVLGGETVDLVRSAQPGLEALLREAVAPAQHDLVVRELSGDFDEWARGAAVIAIQEYVGR